jgi:hypothetical protein
VRCSCALPHVCPFAVVDRPKIFEKTHLEG